MFLQKEDYDEPMCLLKTGCEKQSIPVKRILEKLDGYVDKNDFEAAEKLLNGWSAEAEALGDLRGKLTVVNEQIGLYRKAEMKDRAFAAIKTALELVEKLNEDGTVGGATTFLNAATGYRAFDRADLALPLYTRARSIYEKLLPPDDGRLAGLYNNMAVTLTDSKRFDDAEESLKKALSVLDAKQGSEAEKAITWLNYADLIYASSGPEEGEQRIQECLELAEKLLDTESLPQNGYYAFVCEKCAPVFGYYGWFAAERKFKKRAGEIRERA